MGKSEGGEEQGWGGGQGRHVASREHFTAVAAALCAVVAAGGDGQLRRPPAALLWHDLNAPEARRRVALLSSRANVPPRDGHGHGQQRREETQGEQHEEHPAAALDERLDGERHARANQRGGEQQQTARLPRSDGAPAVHFCLQEDDRQRANERPPGAFLLCSGSSSVVKSHPFLHRDGQGEDVYATMQREDG